jgi:hypothetical protein
MSTNTTYISFGYRCSSAGILKKLQLKYDSYPFDWLISSLSVVSDCIKDNFCEFLKTENYVRRQTKTYDMATSKERFVCDEHILFNHRYQPSDRLNETNTYQYRLAMNHRDITKPEDYQYLQRCVERFKELSQSSLPKKYIHITPLVKLEDYDGDGERYKQFDDFICSAVKGPISGIIFVMVRTNDAEFRTELLPTQPTTTTGTQIYVIYTNKDLVDAGETFIGNYHREQQFIESVILNLK